MRRVFPSQVGFERHLYDFAPYDEDRFSGLEHAYFQPIDNLAAKAKEKLLTDLNREWSSELRSGWTRFLLSLFHRSPESLIIFRRRVREILSQFSPDTQKQYERIRSPEDPDLYLDYFRLDPHYFDLAALRMLPNVIDNGNVGLFINRMIWGVMTLECPDRSLLLSDYPLVISNGIKRADGHLALALGPKHLFVACYQRNLFQHLMSQSSRETTFNYNRCVVERANRFVAAYDTRQRKFIENRFGAKPLNLLEQVFDQVEIEGVDPVQEAVTLDV